MSSWDPARTAEFFDEYGEREWTRFERGVTPEPSIAVHTRMLEGYVRPGDRVLDAGCGPGRFTLAGWDIVIGEDLVARSPDGSHFVGSTVTWPRIQDNNTKHIGLSEAELRKLSIENPRKAILGK